MDFLHSSPSRSMIHTAASGGGNGNLAKNISMLSSVLSLVEKLLPFWASSIISLPTFSVVLGILSYFSAGKLYSRFCSRFSKDAVQAITEAKDSNDPQSPCNKRSVQSCGLLEILISSPDSNGKHINRNSLVANYPLQRYTVSDLKEDIRLKEAKVADLSASSCPTSHRALIEEYRTRARLTLLRLVEEEKIRIQTEDKLIYMQERLEREKKEDTECANLRSELTQEIEQLAQILQFVKEAKDQTEHDSTMDAKFYDLKKEMKRSVEDDRVLRELQATNTILIRQREEDSEQKLKLLRQVARLSGQPSFEPRIENNPFLQSDEAFEKDVEIGYRISTPPVRDFDHSVFNSSNSATCSAEASRDEKEGEDESSTDDFFSFSDDSYADNNENSLHSS